MGVQRRVARPTRGRRSRGRDARGVHAGVPDDRRAGPTERPDDVGRVEAPSPAPDSASAGRPALPHGRVLAGRDGTAARHVAQHRPHARGSHPAAAPGPLDARGRGGGPPRRPPRPECRGNVYREWRRWTRALSGCGAAALFLPSRERAPPAPTFAVSSRPGVAMTVHTSAPRVAAARSIPFARTVIGPDARSAVAQVLESGWVTTGQQVADFEREFADHVGAARGVAVSSCTAGLELALRGLCLARGSRVLMSTNTFCGAAGAITHAGLVPVLADVDSWTAVPTEEHIRAAVRDVGGVSAMVVMHLGGNPVDVEAAAAAAGIGLDHVIEDAAHALGTWVGTRPVGSIARATCFSFYATKNLAIGEGGMVTTLDDDVADDGLKANLTDVQAAIGRAQLRRFDTDQARRREVAARYDAQLSSLPWVSLPPRPVEGRHAWHLYAVRVHPGFPVARDELIDRLNDLGIGTSVHFIPLHRLTWHVEHCVVPAGGLPGADAVFATTLSLPFDQNLSDDDVDEVCAALWRIGGTR